MSKNLIIYYSRADENYAVGFIDQGNTEIAAMYVQELTVADIFKVEPLVPYPKDYNSCIEEAKKRVGNAPIKKTIGDISRYETINIMAPIYWGSYAPELETALNNLNFAGKTVRVITTHEGSGLGTVLQDLKKVCTDVVIDENALAIRGKKVKDSKPLIQRWL